MAPWWGCALSAFAEQDAGALLLAEVLGTSPELWMNLQNRVDLWEAKKERARKVS